MKRIGDWNLIIDDLAAAGAADDGAAADGEEDGDRAKSGSARRRARQLVASAAKGIGPDATVKLFNLAQDPGEGKDLAAEHPEKVKELRAAFDRLAAQAVPPKAAAKPAAFKTPAVWGE
ncbi:MAG: hypothetical protein M3478_03445 [Planctomycetota bacterium]|nr:hypothetical protein [Planctomycetota bacterium]